MNVDLAILVVTLVSHMALFPTMKLFFIRKLLFEFCVSIFGLLASFLYHLCQALDHSIILTGLHWHRLDNIGAISLTGLLFVYFACIKNPDVEIALKYFVFLVTLIFQEQNPWDERYTSAPILLFFLIPVFHLFIIQRHLPSINAANVIKGGAMSMISVFFFVLGLNDAGDPYRVLHGMWHIGIGIASYYLWNIIKPPLNPKVS